MKGRQRRYASHVDDRGCVDADAAEALAGTNVIEAADLTQNAVNDVVDTLADTTVFPTVFTAHPLHVSALFGDNPLHHAIPEDARAEAEQIFDNLGDPAAAGAALTDVVRVGIVTRDLQRDRPVFNQVWAERFGEHRPARSAIQAPDFGRKGRTPGS